MKIILLDYGTGNLQSVKNAIEHLGFPVLRTSSSHDIHDADLVIFPGQGSFGPAMKKLEEMNCIEPLKSHIQSRQPFIGICLGFQLLFEHSEEAPNQLGLGTFEGHFKKFTNSQFPVPHMGWNAISTSHTESVLDQFNNERFYFVHSYYLPSTNAPGHAKTNYGTNFISAIANETQLITQFHPEKSGDVGLALLETFLNQLP
ncbi:MAG: imidazole glycerol phosphate synthase subunit HisH [Candidatus Margulisiibacteriota bacterium]